jgi:opacity protein-like surface antigen
MRTRRLCLLAAVVAVLAATPANAASAPDPTLTPGSINTAVTQATITTTICTAGYTKSIRKVSTKTKSKVYDAYKIPKSERGKKYVIDHLIPLEVGGSNDVANLWPEPKTDSFTKDGVERTLHTRVCSGLVDLLTAERAFAYDWRTAAATATTTTTTSTTTTTTTTKPPSPVTASPTSPPATQVPAPAPAQNVVTAGSFCSPVGATGVTSAGTPMVCSTTSKDGTPYTQPRWRSP